MASLSDDAPQEQALRIMLIALHLYTHLPGSLLRSNREAETDEEDADGSDLVRRSLSVYISSRAHSVRSAALQCIRRLLTRRGRIDANSSFGEMETTSTFKMRAFLQRMWY